MESLVFLLPFNRGKKGKWGARNDNNDLFSVGMKLENFVGGGIGGVKLNFWKKFHLILFLSHTQCVQLLNLAMYSGRIGNQI